MRFTLATSNLHKRDEVEAILTALGISPVEIQTLRDLPHIASPAEDGDSFFENARIKALAVSPAVDGCVLADDSGLEVDALNGRPGIHSARYAGEGASPEECVQKLLRETAGVPFEKRTARFVCVMILARGGQILAEARGVCEGSIAEAPAGSGGFGYDPVFWLPERRRTMAEIPQTEKNRVSHRADALKQLENPLRALRLKRSPPPPH